MFDGEDEEDENMLHPAPHTCLHNSTVEDVTAHHRNVVSDPAHKFDDDYIVIAESREWCTEGVLVVTLDETDWEGLGDENGARKRKRGYDTCLCIRPTVIDKS